MKVLVYPHDLDMGGSQMNAIELAAAVRGLGHECVIFGQRGMLCDKIESLGLEFIEAPRPSHRPTPRIVNALRDLVRERDIDIVHGYEWPPGLEGFLATQGGDRTRAVCTVMSMAVAPFLPRQMPLIVGTRQIAAHELAIGRHQVDVLEPPVDLLHNKPPADDTLREFKDRWNLDERPLVVCVSRLAHELKSEGILTAIEVAGALAGTTPFQLLIVGDGPARSEVANAARRVNRKTGTDTVVMTGELLDPRPAYALADVSIGMGGSALRALGFGAPLIVQGEKGFFRTLTPDSLGLFQWQGWYGVGRNSDDGQDTLINELVPLLDAPARRSTLGAYSREVVQLFSLETAAKEQVRIYEQVLAADPIKRPLALLDRAKSTWQFAADFATKKVRRAMGRSRRDDFNAQPVAAVTSTPTGRTTADASGPILYVPGVRWETLAGTDRNLAVALSQHRDVVWVEARSLYRTLRHRDTLPRITSPAPNIIRLRVSVPPGVSRPVMRDITNWVIARQVRNYLRGAHLQPSAIVAATSDPLLSLLRGEAGVRVYFATDDFVSGAGLLKLPVDYLIKSRERNLKAADLVLAVTPDLARELQRGPDAPIWFPNGANLRRYDAIETALSSPEIHVREPILGVVGQFNERTDFNYLLAAQEAGMGLLLVGPQFFTTDAQADFDNLIGRPNVQWIDQVPPERLPSFMCAIKIGLTPYADTTFNRRSYPLKTLEYLSAGIPVVSTAVPPLRGFDPRFVASASSPEDFVAAIQGLLAKEYTRAAVRASVAGESWDDRARQLINYIESARKCPSSPPDDVHALVEER